MARITDILLIIAVIVGALWTYQIKHRSELSAREIASLRKNITAQNNKITLLQADWAIMTSPNRLEDVAKNHAEELGLARLEPSQIVNLRELPPVRQTEVEERINVDVQDIDRKTTTGSIADLIKSNGQN